MKDMFGRGYCKKEQNNLSFIGTLQQRLLFESFEDFYNRAEEILETFKVLLENPNFSWKEYKNYIYYQHKFSDDYSLDNQAKDKCFEWIMSYEYEYVSKNDLKSVLGQLRKERK